MANKKNKKKKKLKNISQSKKNQLIRVSKTLIEEMWFCSP